MMTELEAALARCRAAGIEAPDAEQLCWAAIKNALEWHNASLRGLIEAQTEEPA